MSHSSPIPVTVPSRHRLFVVAALLAPLAYAPAALAADCVSGTAYPYTGPVDGSGTQTTANCTVPAGVTSMSVVVIGGGGGGGTGANAGAGGSGAKVTVTNFPVTAGATLYMRLGGLGIGGQANSSSGGGRGGHYSSIYTTNTTTVSTIATGGGIIAGGGGGGGMGHTDPNTGVGTGGAGGSGGGANGAGGNGSSGSITYNSTLYTQTGGTGGANGTGGTGGTGVTNGDNGDASNGGLSGSGDKGGRGGSGYGGGGGGGSGGNGLFYSGGGGGGGGSIGPSTGGASTTYESANNGGVIGPVANGGGAGGSGSVTLTFVAVLPTPGQCGTAHNVASATAPAANLCTAGSAGSVVGNSSNGTWTWSCNGINGSTSNASCSAPYASQSITGLAANPASLTIGGTTSATLSATGGASGNAVVFSTSSTNCSVTGSSVSATAAGTCTVKANQAGTGDSGLNRYLAAPEASLPITVNAGSQTISFTSTAPAAAVVGGSGYTPAATGGASGNPVTISLDATSSGCALIRGVVSFPAAGTCVINANQAGSVNYNAAPQVQQSFTVNAVVPGSPTVTGVTPGNTQASVAFTAPASNGGAAITGYTVTSNPGGVTATGAGSPITVTGLTNGTAYTFTVTATNSAGSSLASAASGSVTPKAAQTITFNNPNAQNFGTTPTLTASTTATGLSVSFTSATTGVCTVTGNTLSFVTAGTCTVNANQAGDATRNAAVQVQQSFAVNPVAPSTPTMGAAASGDGRATVSFTPSASMGGAAVTYTVTASPGGRTGTGSGSPITVTGLTNGTAYTFTVTATNSAGSSVASAASASITPAEPPPPTPVVEQGSRTSVSSGVVEVRPTASATQAPGELSVRGSVQMQLGGTGSITIGAQSVGDAPAQIRFTQTPNGTLVPSVQSGTVVFSVPTGSTTGGGNGTPRPVLPIATQPPGADTATQRMVTTTDVPCAAGSTTLRVAAPGSSTNPGAIRVDVGGCPVNLVGLDGNTASAQTRAATPGTRVHNGATVYPGEQMVLDANNTLIAIQLGSTSAVTLAGTGLDTGSLSGLSDHSYVPRLQGAIQRLNNAELSQLLTTQLQGMPTLSDIWVMGDTARVLLSYEGRRHLFRAIGRIHVNTDLTPPRQASAQGGVVIDAEGIAVEFVPSVLNLATLGHAVVQDGGSLRVQADGSYVATLTGVPHVFKATTELRESAQANVALPSGLTPQGRELLLNLQFGYQQTLVPAAADLEGLRSLARSLDMQAQVGTPLASAIPGSEASVLANSMVALSLHGVAYRLQPEMALVPVPAVRLGQLYWTEAGKLYVPAASVPGWAQVFLVR